ncbi:MAG TPA: serine hydrolase domain-containing protein, partial [Gemmatimonadaceae bacterium]|nr:serine hydrolase domain-containing protein [Gemmatimonadaceae bacterium]
SVAAVSLAPAPTLRAQVPTAPGAPVTPPAASAPAPSRGPRDPAELEAFIDGLMKVWMREKHIAGTTVSVVRDGKLLFAKGYGYADVDKRIPVDPERTLFRIGSVSKLFTWTGVMQLHEQGVLDLKKDINGYLDFTIPATYPQPITLTDVLTHTPGLEEDPRDLFTEDSAHITPMSKWLPAHMPARVRPPGTFASYSNWATGVAGYILERKGGEKSWDDYIERRILTPLGMTQTSTRQPLPAALRPHMSVGYEWKNGEYVSHPFEIVTGAAPAGSISASATDMAKFMLAHLNKGALGEGRILGEAETALMHTRLHGHDPRIPGFAHGFYEQSSHGLRLIGHGGDTQWFHSILSLIPSENVGVFMSTNTNTGGQISFLPFLTAFLDHYYPEQLAPLTPRKEDQAKLQRFAGEYVFNRMNFTTFVKVAALAGSIPVSAMPDGTLFIKTPFGAMRLVQEDSLLFRDRYSGTHVAFRADASGKITHAFYDAAPMMVLDKWEGMSSPKVHLFILGGGLAMFLAIIITAIVRFFIRHTPGRPRLEPSIVHGRRALTLAGLMVIAFLAILGSLVSDPEKLLGGTPTALTVGLALPILALLLALWGVWSMVQQWRNGDGTIWMRLRHTGAVAVTLLFFWSLNTWNLLGWKM